MILHILRALFVLLMGAVGWFFLGRQEAEAFGWLTMAIFVSVAVLLICVDILSPRKKLAVFAGTFLGLLVGLLLTWGLSFAIQLFVDLYITDFRPGVSALLVRVLNMSVGIISCYFAISFILQTKDDFRFIIPYVEFSKQVRGARPILVDTSVIIDGRILDMADTGAIESRLIVPRFVLNELQTIADLGDKLKRARGRRGLEVLNKLQANKRVETIIYDWSGHNSPEAEGADQMLLVLAKELNARLLTTDFNLAKVAQVRGVDVVNLNELANALRPVVLPGEKLHVRIIKPGEEASQGVGYLDDGTMVVVDQGLPHLGEELDVCVTNVLQTTTGRMIFARAGDSPAVARRSRPRADAPSSFGSAT